MFANSQVLAFPFVTMMWFSAIGMDKSETVCDRLQMTPEVKLNGLTYNWTHNEIWLIDDNQLYMIPFENLDTTKDQLQMYDMNNSQSIESRHWNTFEFITILENKDTVEWLAILDEHYRFYQFVDTYYVIQEDIGKMCDSYDDKVMPWNMSTMKNPNGTGTLFIGLVQVGDVRRVIFTPMKMHLVKTENDCKFIEVNFPGEETGLNEPIAPKYQYVFLETDAERKTASFVPSSKSKKSHYKDDLFAIPPAAITTPTKLYIFSLKLFRVYIVDSKDLTAALQDGETQTFSVISKPWSAFFICTPQQPSVDPGTEPLQADYMESLGDLYPTVKIDRWSWFKEHSQGITIGVLCVLLSIVAVLYTHVSGFWSCQKNKKRNKKNVKISKKNKNQMSAQKISVKTSLQVSQSKTSSKTPNTSSRSNNQSKTFLVGHKVGNVE